MYTVFVTWADAPKRSERLANGHTTTRRIDATMFPSRDAAEQAARESLSGIDSVLRWRVSAF